MSLGAKFIVLALVYKTKKSLFFICLYSVKVRSPLKNEVPCTFACAYGDNKLRKWYEIILSYFSVTL